MKVKIIVAPNSRQKKNPNNYIILNDGESKFDYNDRCFLENSVFAKKSCYVCISIDDGVFSHRIYRMAISGNRDTKLGSIKKNEIGLLARDVNLLGITNLEKAEINLSFSFLNRMRFYFYNPNYAIRISMWLGSISVILGIISLLLTIYLNFR